MSFSSLPYCICTLQLHGLLLVLIVPLLSHLEFPAGSEQRKRDDIWGGKCTWECSSHSAYLSHDHILQPTATPGGGKSYGNH